MGTTERTGTTTSPRSAAHVRAFLITGLRGYTAFTERHGNEAAARLTERFAAIAGEVVSGSSGIVVEVRGDEVLAAFDSPRDAVRAAVELQAALADAGREEPELPLVAGVGLDAGEAVAVDGGFRGRPLNMAARLCARAGPGEILVTPELAYLTGSIEGIGFEDRGPVRLRGFSRPVHVNAVAPLLVDEPRSRIAAPGVLDFRVLGPLEVSREDRPVELGGRRQRLVLAHLLLQANRVLSMEALIDRVWAEEPPRAARNTIQSYISRLRAGLGGERIEGREPGYVLNTDAEEVDLLRFERLLRRARRQLGMDPKEAAATFQEALALWRGAPFADLSEEPSLAGELSRLEELRLAAIEDLIGARLALGEPGEVIPELETLVAAHPLRERLWAHLMLALYRSGRQAEALEAFARVRGLLAEELGIDPSTELRELHERILRQDPSLELRGQPLRSYRLIERIGEGAFGVVWRAFDPGVGREVAVKQIRPELADDPSFVRRFEQEAQIVARIEHPHVVPLHDFWRDGTGAYLVMRLLRGGSLADALEAGSVGAESIVDISEQIASALSAAHRLHLVHRDVKPENVLLDEEGNAYLSDFGVAEDRGAPDRASTGRSDTEYRSPEQLRGDAATERSDVYALGKVVAAMVRRALPEVPPEAESILARATEEEPSRRFADARELAASLREALAGGAPRPVEAEAMEGHNPYKGLRPFGEADAADFFGRDALVERLVSRHGEETTRFLAVVGPSGSGKSSVVRAGLLPALRRGVVRGSERWFYVDMLPGPHPMEELEAALLRIAPNPPASLIEQLERDEHGLARAVRRVLPGDDTELLLVVDQFEEVFTLVEEEGARVTFLESLAAAVADPRSRLRVVVTLRADFYDRPLAYPGLAELVRGGSETVVPLTAEELERAIAGPAERVGITPELTLVAEVVGDVTDHPGALPLMQYALTETFERSRGGLLTLEAYRETGGVRGALARRAEELFTRMNRIGKEAARQLFLRLVSVGEGSEDARRLVGRSELASLEVDQTAMDAVVETFGRHRLLSFDRDPDTRGPTVEVAHEALLREWGRLRGWIDAAREDVIMHRRLAAEAEEWDRSGRDPSFLLRGNRLAQFEAWTETTGLALSASERDYLRESFQARQAEQAAEEARLARERALERRSIVRMRALVTVLAAAVLVASTLSVVAVGQRGRAEREGRFATARELAAAANANLDVDPERSILLALEAIEATGDDGTVVPEAEQALHDAVASHRLVFTLRHPSTANVEWSPDGRLLATGGTAAGREQHDVVIWDAASGTELHTLSGHTGDIAELAFSPDSSRLVTTGEDDRMILWDTSTWEQLWTIRDLPTWPAGSSFSPDGAELVVGVNAPERSSVEIVDPNTGTIVRTLVSRDDVQGADLGVGLPAFSSDGTRIATPLGANVSIYDARTGDEVRTLDAGSPLSVTYSPDGESLAALVLDHGVTVWDARTGRRKVRLPGFPIGFDWSADGRFIATGESDGTAKIWDAATGVQTLVLAGHTGGVALVSFSPDGTRLLTGGSDGTARVWDISPAATAEWLGAFEPPIREGVEFSPDGRRLLTHGWGRVWVWDMTTVRHARGYDAAGAAVFGPEGATVAYVDLPDRFPDGPFRVRVVATESGEPVHSVDVRDWPPRIASSPDGSVVATGGSPRVRVWDVASGELMLGELGEPDQWMEDVAFSPDGKHLAGISELATLYVWEFPTGNELVRLQAHSGFGTGVSFSPDGTMLATTGGDGAAVWNLAGEQLASMTGVGKLEGAAFSPDGERLATAGADGTARIWDVAAGQEVLSLAGHAGAVRDVAFSPDGSRLASVSEDGTLRVSVLRLDELVRIARARLTRGFTDQECRRYLHLPACTPSLSAAPTPSAPPSIVPKAVVLQGAFRVPIRARDLPAPPFRTAETESFNRAGTWWHEGTYTWSLVDGYWRMHLERVLLGEADPLSADEWSGTYSVSGDRIRFEIENGDARCFGTEISGRWSVDEAGSLTFTDVTWPATGTCGPQRLNDAWVQTVFESRPWIRLP